jgi:hypothetical protein
MQPTASACPHNPALPHPRHAPAPRSAIWPSAAATGLLQQLRPTLVSQAIKVITTMDAAPDPVSTISAALQVRVRDLGRRKGPDRAQECTAGIAWRPTQPASRAWAPSTVAAAVS